MAVGLWARHQKPEGEHDWRLMPNAGLGCLCYFIVHALHDRVQGIGPVPVSGACILAGTPSRRRAVGAGCRHGGAVAILLLIAVYLQAQFALCPQARSLARILGGGNLLPSGMWSRPW